MSFLPCARAATVLAGFAIGAAAFGAHPLQTEDAGTQGEGGVEIEGGLCWFRGGDFRQFTGQPQISYGLTPAFDLIVQPSWLRVREADGSARRGWGDTNLDAKWRFFEAGPVSLAVRAGATLATSQHGLGASHGEVATHALFAASFDAAPFAFHGDLGLARNPAGSGERRTIGRVSAATTWAAAESLVLAAGTAAETSHDPARSGWTGSVLAGAIFTLRPGLDVDVGVQAGVHTPVLTREWMLGLTYRFTP